MPRQGTIGDACMVLVFPITQFDVEYRFGCPDASAGSFQNFALIVARQSDKDTIFYKQVGYSALRDLDWSP